MVVPLEKAGELLRFDGSLLIDRTRGTVAARSDSEANNMLMLNLAHDIAAGKRTADSARRFYADAAAKALSGKSTPYASGLSFKPLADTGDPDRQTPP